MKSASDAEAFRSPCDRTALAPLVSGWLSTVAALADHLAPDCIARLERAAAERLAEAELLRKQRRWLAAMYLYGYTIEMCLAAAYFRSAGFHVSMPIDRDTPDAAWLKPGNSVPRPANR